ncbi:heme-degrading domain-containing protein [Massilia sp. TSP1-1-2]|uniref:heme-degrading domain-containing protein n=1 Tax=unclassified Massilia TaxID=2609279 RepID=UPI003CF090F1
MKALILSLACGAASAQTGAIKVNQVGFPTQAAKEVVAPASQASTFELVDAASGKRVFGGKLGAPQLWKPSMERVVLADFSAFGTPGRYRVKLPGTAPSDPFSIGEGAYRALNSAALKSYYFNRSGVQLERRHAGVYARAEGHRDEQVLVHASAANASRPEGTIIASGKGWYDAGDYNKYIASSGIATYTLLAAFEHFPAYFAGHDIDIPESGNALPDILDEALWNLEWMLSMQDPADGGVYHKLTNLRFDAMVMPAQTMKEPRYVVAKSTAATLDFAATMAVASRVFKPYQGQLAARMLAAAQAAWTWAQAHPDHYFTNPAGVVTGEYGDTNVADERAWAAAELYITSGEDSYYSAMQAPSVQATVPAWDDVRSLAWISLAHHRAHLTGAADQALIATRIESLAATLRAQWQTSAYHVAMQEADFVWGSNAVVLNQSMMLLQAYRLSGNGENLKAAQAGLDYVLGRNATGTSFVTGFGARAPLHPHHRPSQADQVAAPVPGMLTGGPQNGQQDKAECSTAYPSALAALSYLDNVCSYASNEIAINWNAPLVYVTAALDQLTGTTMEQPDAALAAIARQEQALQFDAFDNRTALAIGLEIIAMARKKKQSVAVNITRNGTLLFYHGMDGTSADHQDWIRRKSNLVNRTGHSSMYVHADVKNKGGDIDAIATLDPREYAAHGGAFPLTVKGAGAVGTITVSGLPGPQDHALVVAALKSYLKIRGEL